MQRSLLTACCVCLLLLAGCSTTAPTSGTNEETMTVDLSLQNDDATTYNVTVTVLPESTAGLRVTYANGSAREFPTVSRFADLPPDARSNLTAVDVLDTETTTKRYRLTSRTGVGDTLTDVPQNATVVVLVARLDGQNQSRSQGAATCPESTVMDLRVTIAADGSASFATACRSESESRLE